MVNKEKLGGLRSMRSFSAYITEQKNTHMEHL